MIGEFANNNIIISKVYHCPHHPSLSGACSCRKPEAGMLLQAQKEFNINLEKSIIIGDKERDIEAGINAGLKETYLFDENGSVRESKATKIVSKLKYIWEQIMLILNSGGTLNKRYNKQNGDLEVPYDNNTILKILKSCNFNQIGRAHV